jgi:hypothetical protein
MKEIVIIMGIQGAVLLSCFAEDISFGGQTLKNIRISNVNPAQVTIVHSTGISVVPISELPTNFQSKLSYDPLKAQEYIDEQNEILAAKMAAKQEFDLWQTRCYHIYGKAQHISQKENGILIECESIPQYDWSPPRGNSLSRIGGYIGRQDDSLERNIRLNKSLITKSLVDAKKQYAWTSTNSPPTIKSGNMIWLTNLPNKSQIVENDTINVLAYFTGIKHTSMKEDIPYSGTIKSFSWTMPIKK